MENVTEFWLDEVGVDGFRLDAAKHLIENKRLQENHAPHMNGFKSIEIFIKRSTQMLLRLENYLETTLPVWTATPMAINSTWHSILN